MKEGQKYICIKEYSINDDCLFTKGEVYKIIKREMSVQTRNPDKWLIECNATLDTKPFPLIKARFTRVPISVLQDKFSEYLLTEKQIRKLKLKRLNSI